MELVDAAERCGEAYAGVLKGPRVMIIEDDRHLAAAMQDALRLHGMEVEVAHYGRDAVPLFRANQPDVVLVDLDLPDISGEAILRWLIGQPDCAVMIVSGHNDEARRVVCLEMGADDYVVKPIGFRELIARVHALHRRAARAGGKEPADQPLGLTSAEAAVLQALIDGKGKSLGRERLSEIALRKPWSPDDRSVDQIVYRIRNKLTVAGYHRNLIQSVRNGGYRMTAEIGRDLG